MFKECGGDDFKSNRKGKEDVAVRWSRVDLGEQGKEEGPTVWRAAVYQSLRQIRDASRLASVAISRPFSAFNLTPTNIPELAGVNLHRIAQ